MASTYDPKNWYWIIAGDATKAYSSAVGDYVPAADATYQAWLAAGNAASRIASEDELGEVLDPYALRPNNANVLDKYLTSQVNNLTLERIAKVSMSHENRIRVLEGKPPLSAAGFRTAIKALL